MACLNSISMLRENLLEATKVTISIVNYLKNFMVLSNASCFNSESTMLKFNEMKVICNKVKIVMVLFYALEMSILKRTYYGVKSNSFIHDGFYFVEKSWT